MGFLVHTSKKRSGRRLLNIYFAAEAAAAFAAVRKVLYNSSAHTTLRTLYISAAAAAGETAI